MRYIFLIVVFVVLLVIWTAHNKNKVNLFVNYTLLGSKENVTCVPVLSTPLQFTVKLPNKIPVFMYWHSNNLPPTVELCLKNWKYFAKKSKYNFEPVLVTDDNLASFIDVQHPCIVETHKYPATKSDFIRLYLLKKYGGVYMDASTILTEPLDWLIGNGSGYNYFQAFVNQKNMNLSCQIPIVENNFLATPPNHPLIDEWLNSLLNIERCEDQFMKSYIRNVDTQKHLQPLYHIAYHALTKVLTEKPLKEFPNIFLVNDINYLNFSSNGNVDVLTQNIKVKYNRLLKLVSWERTQLDTKIKKGKIEPNSFIDKFLLQIQ